MDAPRHGWWQSPDAALTTGDVPLPRRKAGAADTTAVADDPRDAAVQAYIDVGREAADRLLHAVKSAARVGGAAPDLFDRGKASSGSQLLLLTFPNTGTTMTQVLGHCIAPGSFCTAYRDEAVFDTGENDYARWMFHQRDVSVLPRALCH